MIVSGLGACTIPTLSSPSTHLPISIQSYCLHLNMPWAEPYEIDFLNSRVQEFQDSMNSKSARAKFWENLRRDWKAQWDLPDKKNSVSHLFRLILS